MTCAARTYKRVTSIYIDTALQRGQVEPDQNLQGNTRVQRRELMCLPRSRSAMAKRCPFLVLCVLLAGHAIVERLSGQVVTGQVIDSTSSVTIVVSYGAGKTNRSWRTCATLTARSGDISQSFGRNSHVRDTVSVHVIPWHPEGIVFHWDVNPRSSIGGCPTGGRPAVFPSSIRGGGNCRASRMPLAVERRSSGPVYIEPGHTFVLRCPQDLTLVP